MFRRILALVIIISMMIPLVQMDALAAYDMPYRIDVDITNQIVTVYRTADGSIVRQMICSSGANNATPLGTFYLTTRESTDRKAWYWIDQFSTFVKYATRITGSILFHSIPYKQKDLNTINKTALKQLGNAVSHGCIRLRWEDAKWISLNCLDGTRVRMYKGAPANPDLRRLLLIDGFSTDCGFTYDQFLATGYAPDETRLGRGSDVEAVKGLQNLLAGHGFYAGEIDGVYDNATILSLMRYQAACGLRQDGVATMELIDHLAADDDTVGGEVVPVQGMRGPLVTRVQTLMRAIGFYQGGLDGVFTADLGDALAMMSTYSGMKETHDATPEVMTAAQRLLDSLNSHFGEGAFDIQLNVQSREYHRTAKKAHLYKKASTDSDAVATLAKHTAVEIADSGKSGWYKVTASGKTGYMLTSAIEAAKDVDFTVGWGYRVDELGVRSLDGDTVGEAVRSVQARLKALGFYTGRESGIYSSATADAVRAYQRAAKLPEDGAASVDAQRRMFETDDITGTVRTLEAGSEGLPVRNMQRWLRSLQYYSGEATGVADGATIDAVRLFARSNGYGAKSAATPAIQQAIHDQFDACEAAYGSGNYTLTISSILQKTATARSACKLSGKAGPGGLRLATLPQGAKAQMLHRQGSWVQVSYEGKVGYVPFDKVSLSSRETLVAEFNVPDMPAAGAMLYGTEEDGEAEELTQDADPELPLGLDIHYEELPEESFDIVEEEIVPEEEPVE